MVCIREVCPWLRGRGVPGYGAFEHVPCQLEVLCSQGPEYC
jgi:hypothetical protein